MSGVDNNPNMSTLILLSIANHADSESNDVMIWPFLGIHANKGQHMMFYLNTGRQKSVVTLI